EKDVWELARQVVRERRKRELEPILKVLKAVNEMQADNTEESKEFKKVVKDLKGFAEKSDQLLETFSKSEESWFWSSILKLFK
ncbi:MAG TPA: transcriptional regulator, partial [Cyclobacteriaceae bacterium]|nr:transcriptional regulator [Cyclobacteriaceae bacterium]